MPRQGYKSITITEELYEEHLNNYENNLANWRKQGITSFAQYISKILVDSLKE